jgi:hypothetical protein
MSPSVNGMPPMLARIVPAPEAPAVAQSVVKPAESHGWAPRPPRVDPSGVIERFEQRVEASAQRVAPLAALPWKAGFGAARVADSLVMKIINFFWRAPF